MNNLDIETGTDDWLKALALSIIFLQGICLSSGGGLSFLNRCLSADSLAPFPRDQNTTDPEYYAT